MQRRKQILRERLGLFELMNSLVLCTATLCLMSLINPHYTSSSMFREPHGAVTETVLQQDYKSRLTFALSDTYQLNSIGNSELLSSRELSALLHMSSSFDSSAQDMMSDSYNAVSDQIPPRPSIRSLSDVQDSTVSSTPTATARTSFELKLQNFITISRAVMASESHCIRSAFINSSDELATSVDAFIHFQEAYKNRNSLEYSPEH